MSDTQFGMVIDLRGCMGCQTCVVGCKTSNEFTGEGFWNHVLDYSDGEVYMATSGDAPAMKFRPTLCNHCESPVCVTNCPTGAMHKSEETGIVSVDQDICIGCGTCEKSCPYGAPVIDSENMVSTKCNLCAGRTVEGGKDPYCVAACPARVRTFGDLSDPNSEVSKLISENDAQQYLPENGTNPSVYYILPTA